MRSLSGCEAPSQDPVWEYDGDQWFSCPILFVPETVSSWYEEYAHDKEFGSRLSFEDRPARWIEALNLYRGCLTQWQEEALAKAKQEAKLKKGAVRGT